MNKMDRARELSRQLALVCGLRPLSPQGELQDKDGNILLQWWKCPRHNTWMQPCFCGDYPHWHCLAENCGYIRAAKMRTKIEREIFSIARHLEEHA